MAMSALRSSMFTFESTVHSCHMLRCLDEQRRSDVLCDVTVVVEGQSFRAHRSVLASCSEYFTQKFASFMQHGAVITLPEEVTVEGFEPLLNFAYTSKLLFGKDDVLEIRNAASILGFQDLDEGCFDFVLPKFFSGSKSSAPFLGKICCKKKCKRRLSKQDSGSDCDCVLLDEKEVKPVADSSAPQEATWNCDRSVNNKMGSRRSPDTDAHVVEESNDHVRQCPKYRKFQIACGKENCITEKNPTAPDVPISDEGLFSFSPCSKGDKTQKPATAPGPDACSSQLHLQDPHADSSDRGSGCGQSTSLEWLKLRSSFSPPRSSCPAFQDPLQGKCVWKGPGLSECEGASQSGVSSLNSGEDGDSETETEGDSEFYSQERARQVQLPFSVDWIVNLNRNDFQQLLKQQVFTGEQLECVHDMRRRSKNRLAAQRCRKRKLDCIYNLQCEINKLKTEREKLMMEKSQLSQLKTKACHSVSALCQRVCSEANLHPEQVQVLAKYTTPDCPLASFFPHIDTLLSQHGPPHGRAPEEPQFTPSTDTFMGQQQTTQTQHKASTLASHTGSCFFLAVIVVSRR
uniref:BTB and CNC homology 1, basic leucine zipper transcription factor 1 b n=1 Tax=Salarias fasciatus TaxID=181472 RepID=A0A672GPA8_SALFA